MIVLPLSKGYEAVVDDIDAHLAESRWFASECWRKDGTVLVVYAKRNMRKADGQATMEYLHRVVLGALPGIRVDHIDHDGLNCSRLNLRVATPGQNNAYQRRGIRNTSGYKGVVWAKRDRCWLASVGINGRMIYLGRFKSAEYAALAYDEGARKYHGAFACPNFPLVSAS